MATTKASGESAVFFDFNSPGFKEFIRNGGAGGATASGVTITPKSAMKNTTVLRCVSLISFSVGMLPFHIHETETKAVASDHPLDRILHRRPNPWQTAFEFRSYLQQIALERGDAFARIVWSGNRVLYLVPFSSRDTIKIEQNTDWSLTYRVTKENGRTFDLPQREVFHLRYGLSEDGLTGLSLVAQAAEAIALSLQAERAAARLFRNGMMAGAALKHPTRLGEDAYNRLQESMASREGADNAFKTIILEEGMEFDVPPTTGRDSQAVEQRKHQIEEIARPFGVPRPLLGVDDTSWGSGIDVLGQFFVRYALNPWFAAWEQAIERSLLSEADARSYYGKFNAGALLRGSMKDQAEFFSRALGSGGSAAWMHQDEVREISDLPPRDDLAPALTQTGD